MKASSLKIRKWLNCSDSFKFDISDNSIKIIHFFQMLCPGCIYSGIPQLIELYKSFHDSDIQIIGIHSVFENHHVMTEDALRVFIKEWRLPFPIGIDNHEDGEWMPETMKEYRLQGTPSMVVVDQIGDVRMNHFGHIDQQEFEVFITDLTSEKSFVQRSTRKGDTVTKK